MPVRRRRAESFESLFQREFDRSVRQLALLAGPEAAADAVQEAFIVADRQWSAVGTLDDPGAWIRRVAVNKLLNQARSSRRSLRREELVAEVELVTDLIPDVDLTRAVRSLPDQQRYAVCLHYMADLSVKEVADILSLSPGTVKSHLHDARRGLQIALVVADG